MAFATPMGLEALKEWVGKEIGVTGWLEVTQERVNRFAEATEDRQWIHTDPERARKDSPYGVTVAHGFLTLSLLSRLLAEAVQVSGIRMAVNYGLNRVRFPAPVRVGTKIRARVKLLALQRTGDGVKPSLQGSDATYALTVEGEGSDKPVCVAEWIVRYYV